MSGAQPEDAFVAVTQLYVAIIATGYAVQAVGSLRGEETAGRLEMRLSGHPVPLALARRPRARHRHRPRRHRRRLLDRAGRGDGLVDGHGGAPGSRRRGGRGIPAGRAPRRRAGARALRPAAQGVPGGVGRLRLRRLRRRSWARASSWPGGCSTCPRRPMSATLRWAPSRRCRSSSSVPSPRCSAWPRRSVSAVGGYQRPEPLRPKSESASIRGYGQTRIFVRLQPSMSRIISYLLDSGAPRFQFPSTVLVRPAAIECFVDLVGEAGEFGSFDGIEILGVGGGFEPDQLCGDDAGLVGERCGPSDFTE